VLDGHDVHPTAVIVDAVDHPVVAAADAVQTPQPQPERLADPVRAGRQEPYKNSTTATATFPGSRASTRQAAAVQAMA
jgi:hypothetical protein